jgi:hypothetical protein
MPYNFKEKLRIEESQNYSGKLKREGTIRHLRENDYCIMPFTLDGDAPKQFIKAYFYEPKSKVYKINPKTWKKYIAKSAEKWYPHESVIEFLVNRVGEVLELKMNGIKLVKANEQIRFLSEYFLDSHQEIMIHGAEICGEYLEDIEFAKKVANDKKSARELFSFEFISEAIKTIFPENYESLLIELVKLIVFDAITGNNDRHFYNWAIIRPIRKKEKLPYFAPIYDSARGFMWNWSDEALIKHYENLKQGGKTIDKYIRLASPRISIEGNAKINHFELVAYIYTKFPKYQETINELISFKKEQVVLEMYSEEFTKFFINERNQLVKLIISTRFNNLVTVKN